MAVRLRFMRHTALFSTFSAALLLAAPSAHALFKVVGPDGRVTYTTAHDLADDVPASTKKRRRSALMAEQKRIVARAQKRRVGAQVQVMVDGPSPEHELVWRGRLAGQAPEIDPVVYFTDADPDALRPGALLQVEIVGSREYDLVARPL